MRIRWASSSSQLVTVPPVPSHAIPGGKRAFCPQKKPTRHAHDLKRTRSTLSRAMLHESVTMAKSMAMKKEKVKIVKNQKLNTRVTYSHVYVGNIDPIISKEDLETLFKDCGVVSCIQIRCSRGQAVNKGVAVPTAVRTERDRQYATVEFRDPKAVLNAVKKNGTILKGCQLLVSVSAADLPEVKDIMQFRLGRLRGFSNPYNLGVGTSRPILVEPTQEAITIPRTDRHRLLGISFAKCIA